MFRGNSLSVISVQSVVFAVLRVYSCSFVVKDSHGAEKPISIGAFGSCVFTITALARCTSMSLYLISSIGCKENSYDFFGGNHE